MSQSQQPGKSGTAAGKEIVTPLPTAIPEIESFEFGRNIINSERSFDFALVALFENIDALKCYQRHPEHQEIPKLVMAAGEHIFAVDYHL